MLSIPYKYKYRAKIMWFGKMLLGVAGGKSAVVIVS